MRKPQDRSKSWLGPSNPLSNPNGPRHSHPTGPPADPFEDRHRRQRLPRECQPCRWRLTLGNYVRGGPAEASGQGGAHQRGPRALGVSVKESKGVTGQGKFQSLEEPMIHWVSFAEEAAHGVYGHISTTSDAKAPPRPEPSFQRFSPVWFAVFAAPKPRCGQYTLVPEASPH